MAIAAIGNGFDVHRFSKSGKPLLLGGALIPTPLRIDAVSDGDVLIHAIADAICGACCLGDIGDYFPPKTTPNNIKSNEILAFILKKIPASLHLAHVDHAQLDDRRAIGIRCVDPRHREPVAKRGDRRQE